MRKTYLYSLALLLAGCTIIDRQGPPAVQTLTTNYGEQPHVGRGKDVVLTISASDPDNDELDFTWTAVPLDGVPGESGKFRNPRAGTAPLDTLVGIFQDTISVVWQAPALASRYLLRVRITDGRNILTDSLFVDVTQRPPLANAGGDVRLSYVDAGTVKLDGSRSSDPDQDQLSFIWQLSPCSGPLPRETTASRSRSSTGRIRAASPSSSFA